MENSIDRLPEHTDNETITNLLSKIKLKLKLIDGWRENNEKMRDYTFSKINPTATARIDQIYVTQSNMKNTLNWEINESYNLSDHRIASVIIKQMGLPKIAKGLWRLGNNTEHLHEFQKQVKDLLKQTNKKIKQHKLRYENTANEEKPKLREESNPQIIWQSTKAKIQKMSIAETKNHIAQINKPKNRLQQKILNLKKNKNTTPQSKEKK